MQLTITNIALFLSLFASVNALPVADVLPTTEVAVASYDNNETSGIEARQASEVVVKSCLAINFQGDCRTIPTTKGECRMYSSILSIYPTYLKMLYDCILLISYTGEFGTVFSSGFEDHVSSVASDSPCTWFA